MAPTKPLWDSLTPAQTQWDNLAPQQSQGQYQWDSLSPNMGQDQSYFSEPELDTDAANQVSQSQEAIAWDNHSS